MSREAARTLDEQQAEATPEPTQALPEPEGPASPEETRERHQEKESEEPTAAELSPEVSAGSATVVSSNPAEPVGYHRQGNLPPGCLVTPGEFVLAVAAAAAVFFALRWTLGRLADEIAVPQAVAAHPSLIALAVGAGIGASLWSARRAKRINRAKHLRGELPT